MQTRKRAKSVTFGKPEKTTHATEEAEVKAVEKEEKKEVAVEEKSEVPKKIEEPKEPTEAAKKVIAIEEDAELSDTPQVEEPKKDGLSDKPEAPEAVVTADNFITDTQPTKSNDQEEEESKETSELSAAPEPSLSSVLEPEAKTDEPVISTNQELSPTPPPSAFSIQDAGDSSMETGEKKRNFFVYFLVIALFSFILGIGAMAVISSGLIPGVSLPKDLPFVSQLGSVMTQPTPTVAPTTAPVPTTAPTEEPADLKAFTISVLNGSGIRGKAADVKTSLTTAGFTVSSTGNAANSEFTTTQISAKKDVDEAYLDKLQTELEKEFKVQVASAPAPASQTTDVVVTIGSTTK